jgi:hypothetical protein
MSTPVAVVKGTITEAGTLEIHEKVNLPRGEVQVTLVPLPELPADDPFWQRMGSMWAGQNARGHVPRSVEEVEAERQAMREEWDKRMTEIVRIQHEAEQLRSRDSRD